MLSPLWMAILFIMFSLPLKAAPYVYAYTRNCSDAYQNFLSLHTAEGRACIITEIKSDPYNLMATYVADYEDCIVLLLNCDKDVYKDRAAHFDARIELLEKGEKSSPWYRFCLGGVYLHWALINTRFGEQYKAAVNFHKSYALLKENSRLFPQFEYNTVFTGLQDAVIGSLPGNYKWLAAIFGIKGDLKRGVQNLGAFVSKNNTQQPLYLETVLYYAYTRFYLLNEEKEVWDFLNSTQFNTRSNLLNAFVKVNISLDYRKADEAVATLRESLVEPNYLEYPIFSYQRGAALLGSLDTACVKYFEQYISTNKSGLLIKDCWQKMALCWYLNSNPARANYCLEQARQQGSTRTDADKQANKFAENKVWPERRLLAARLLIDGGHYTKALILLQQINEALLSVPDKVEYAYRLGKAYELAGDIKRALDCYATTITTGKNRQEQFAARAALQMGLIYEHSALGAKAIACYQQCLDMPTHDFQNSIDQQAKAGIARVSGNTITAR